MDYKERVNERLDELYNKIPEQKKDEVYKKQRKTMNIVSAVLFLFLAAIGVIFIVFGIPEPDISGFMIGGGIFLIVFGIGLVSVIQWIIRDKEKTIKLLLRVKAKKETSIEFEEENIKSEFGDFKIDKEIRLYDVSHIRSARLLIDTKRKRFIYAIGKDYSSIIEFKDILSYEVYEDGDSVVKGSAGRALIGGAFFGLTGAIIGSSGKRKVSNYCSSLKLLIRINDIDNPQIEITFINSQVEKDSSTYKNCIKSLQEISSYFEYMINSKTLEEPKPSSVEKTQVESKSKKEQLIELKELFEEGLITEEDYNKKKQDILN